MKAVSYTHLDVYKRQLLTTIKGIGITLATALIITTGGFTYFQNAKQVSRYLGILSLIHIYIPTAPCGC